MVRKSGNMIACACGILASIGIANAAGVQPYQSGEMTIFPYRVSEPVTTITLAGDIRIKMFAGYSVAIGGWAYLEGGFALDTSAALSGGIAYDTALSSIAYDGHLFMWNNSYTTGSPDTVWANALKFPDSLAPFDTFFIYRPGSQGQEYDTSIGTWSFYSYQDAPEDTWYCISGGMAGLKADGRTIVYITYKDGTHIKFQVFQADLACTTTTCHVGVCDLVSIHLRWACDSLGNGIFAPPTRMHAGLPERASVCVAERPKCIVLQYPRSLPLKADYCGYDISGRFAGRFANGVFSGHTRANSPGIIIVKRDKN
jgi:hypothetical protein